MANELCYITKIADDYAPIAALGYVAYYLYDQYYLSKRAITYWDYALNLAIAGGALYLAHNTLQPLEQKVC